ncbi:hypothetical protein J5N97_022592 [Dioscorea zingiberensis]|uniref:Uncharacterized protein n=1 Tax=Dioscorea zingiberensis TaxID=325984 RepID=A0A9D5CC90_9LILI|nr:hypothetical protein J5N97_022592 [Dioscorea zingiberensis]
MDFLVEDMKTYNDETRRKVVENCKTSCEFNVRPIQDLISNLYSHWSDVGCPCINGIQNWKHTWCTYGQCSNLTQHNYIQTALNIAHRANQLEVFEANDIVPSASTTYKLEDIQRALQANLGSATYLECYNRGWIFPTSMLYKINICISKNGKSIIDNHLLHLPENGEKCRWGASKMLPKIKKARHIRAAIAEQAQAQAQAQLLESNLEPVEQAQAMSMNENYGDTVPSKPQKHPPGVLDEVLEDSSSGKHQIADSAEPSAEPYALLT